MARDRLYGVETVIDLYGCCPETIASESLLREYLRRIVAHLRMAAYGEPVVERFGLNAEHTVGHSIVQLIETSSITGHFSETWNTAHLNVFSCKPYDSAAAYDFTRRFFGATDGEMRVLERYGEPAREPAPV